MKKILLLFIVAVWLTGCKQDETYTTLSVNIANAQQPEVKLYDASDNTKPVRIFQLDKQNHFQDTITVKPGIYYLSHNKGYIMLHLSPGEHIDIATDAEHFMSNISVKGGHKTMHRYYKQKNPLQENAYATAKNYYHLKEKDFKVKFDSLKNQFTSLLADTKNAPDYFITFETKSINDYFDFIAKDYQEKQIQYQNIGKPSPAFENYRNYNGGTTSLSDLKGKYTYIDVWATWCRPCREELPFLKVLEEKYGDRINFVSISVDKDKDYDKWKTFVKEQDLKGYQLFEGQDKMGSSFSKAYQITSIPRFILIDPQGYIYNPDAWVPSDPRTDKYLASLLSQ